ncbi:serine/threonine-protein kinase [Actinomadura rayongensis]|uniref:non-specific serine/threonine protein kinase n=1 Tax=Actinomadura rayongensis TaxID=1429076 RepID=A0A6I4WDN8_9ACTN|nr:serine/threonine-protein kinase [Actinomadura rayongensis]MXQ66940.1 protein kinase [Actinomadura rayongensis]
MLGAGLVDVPPVPYQDPSAAVLKDPRVPEARRFCSACGAKVGRGRDGRPGRTEGFCSNCRHPFSFTPKLRGGDLVVGQYEVLGCLAHGGLGWVYLARDRNVSDRWVVLKGRLDDEDADALAAATAERAFLAEAEHPNIVKIYNFVRHAGSGYIVMEYVGGESLKDILKRHRAEHGAESALPLGQVIAYGLEVLRALGYLHGVGLLYCDFKPDNAIQSEEQLKLIDLGGVRRTYDTTSPIFGTEGYQAPEISDRGASVASDLYTVGRTLAVLSFPFRGYTGRYRHALPPRADVPLLRRFESYDRLLRRATDPVPERRFASAAEMADQLTGVLREVLSAEDGRPRPAPSPLFATGPRAAGTELTGALDPAEAAAALPVPHVHPLDPAAPFLGGLADRDPEDLAAALAAAPARTPEVRFALVRVRIELGDAEAGPLLDELAGDLPGDWRVAWYRGVRELAAGHGATAAAIFDGLYGLFPGEIAPKLALAFARETEGAPAGRLYETVWRTDPTHVSAAFGLARVRLAAGDAAAAVAVLDSVPRISSHWQAARIAAFTAAVRSGRALDDAALRDADRRLRALPLDTERRARFTADLLEAALARPGGGTGDGVLLDVPLREGPLRRRLEHTYRQLAKLADGPAERHALVRRANAVRPRTLF